MPASSRPLLLPSRTVLAAMLVACGCGASAAPQDLTGLPLEQLLTMDVFSASKFIQKSSQAPALVTVITAADIKSYGWRTLGDIARSVRGLYVGYDRNYSYLGARGFLRPGDYNTRFLLLVDGNRVNDAVYDQAPAGGEFPLDLALVERVEFVPGPGSSIYGSNAFFGVINVVTKKNTALAGTRAALEAGSAGARKASASSSWRSTHGAAFLLAASTHRTNGKDLYYPEFD
ncbi:MAG: TonB-dependent receptor plug domain-containing protein, partial [Telluria sp.]